MLPLIIILVKRIDDHLKVFGIAQEIGIAGIDEQGFYVMLFYIVRIGLLNIQQVFVGNMLFVRTIALFYIRL